MDKTTVMAEFIIYGEHFPIEDVSKRLALEPTGYHVKGEKIREKVERIETFWFINTDYEESVDINDQLNQLIELLKEKENELLTMQSEFAVEYKFCIVIRVEKNEKPAMYLTQEVIAFISSIKAWVDFDLYIF